MSFVLTQKQPEPISLWLDEGTPGITGRLENGDALVEFDTGGGFLNFIRCPIDRIPGICAALQAIYDSQQSTSSQ